MKKNMLKTDIIRSGQTANMLSAVVGTVFAGMTTVTLFMYTFRIPLLKGKVASIYGKEV